MPKMWMRLKIKPKRKDESMADDNRKYELLKNLENQVDNDSKEVTIKIDALDPDAPYTLGYTFTLQTYPGNAKEDVFDFLCRMWGIMKAEVVEQKK